MMSFKKLVTVVLLGFVGFMQAKQVVQETDIFWDIHYGDTKAVQRWLKSDQNIEQLNNDGQSILIKAVIKENKFLVRKLLSFGVEVNVIDNFGKTALDYAVQQENKAIIRLLLKEKAKVTSDINAVHCREIVAKRSGWRIFAAIALGLVGVVLLGSLTFTLLFAAGDLGAGANFLATGFGVISLFGGGITYGVVKTAGTKHSSLHVVLIDPMIG